jgi:hypothetical protein
MSTLSSLKLGLVAGALASSALVGCGGPEACDAGAVRFAVSSRAALEAGPTMMRIVNTTVLSTHVDLRQPLDVQRAGNRVEVKFAVRQREGATYRLDPASLAPTSITSFTFDQRATAQDSYYLRTDTARVSLDESREVVFVTDEQTGRVFARFDGSDFPISDPVMTVVGPPRAAAIDSRHALVAYFVVTQEGCALVASTLELAQ